MSNDTITDYPHFLGSEIDMAAKDAAKFHIIPIPYERSVSYGGGTANGPSAVLKASWQLETFDGKSHPCEKGIYTHEAINCDGKDEEVMQRIAAASKLAAQNKGIPIAIGGEHSITAPLIKGLLDAGMDDIGVVQIDAHADLRDAYEGNQYSHASVMKRVVDMGIPIYQLGVRALCDEEEQLRSDLAIPHIDAETLILNHIKRIKLPSDFPSNVYFTFDIDGLDPSIFPATGTPVPGGLSWYQALSLFKSVARQRKIVGFDVVEVAPIPNIHAYEFTAAHLIYQMMGIVDRASV